MFYLFTFAINLWQIAGFRHSHSRSHCSVCQQSTWQRQDFYKKFLLKGVHSKEVD